MVPSDELVERRARDEEPAADASALELPFSDQAPNGLRVHAEQLRNLADARVPFSRCNADPATIARAETSRLVPHVW